MTLRVLILALGASLLLSGCHGRLSIGPEDSAATANAAPVNSATPTQPTGHFAVHVHEVENSETGIEYKWSIDGTGPASGSNTTTTSTTNMQPICLAISPSDSQKFHCEVTVRAEADGKNKVHYSERTVTVISGTTRSQSTDWPESGQLKSNFKTLVKKDGQFESPKQLVLATAAGKPVSVRIGD